MCVGSHVGFLRNSTVWSKFNCIIYLVCIQGFYELKHTGLEGLKLDGCYFYIYVPCQYKLRSVKNTPICHVCCVGYCILGQFGSVVGLFNWSSNFVLIICRTKLKLSVGAQYCEACFHSPCACNFQAGLSRKHARHLTFSSL